MEKAINLSNELSKNNIEFIIDDTDDNFSSKIKKFNLIGIPFQIMIGNKNDGTNFEFREVGQEHKSLQIDKIIEQIKINKK